MSQLENGNSIFPKGDKAPADYFSGNAWVKILMSQGAFDFVVANVVFEAGVRNNWHTHPGGQILIATEGIGYYQEKGKPIQTLRKGDVVAILPEVKHWHGASPKSDFTHIVITPNEKGTVTWLERVSDEDYKSLK